MIRYILLGLTLFIVPAFFFLLNCAQPAGPGTAGATGGSTGTDGGFSPGGSLNRGGGGNGGEGFEPNQGTQYSTVGHSPQGSNNDPFHRSASVQENEKRWGTSAPIGKAESDDIDQDVFEDFRLGKKINTMDDIVDFRVYVKLKKTGSGRRDGAVYRNYYGGVVTIGYYDYDLNKPVRVRLRSGTGNDAKYNLWLTGTGSDARAKTFHGFFQERDRAVIFVIDKETPLARNAESDAINTLYGGSIWIMAFKTIFPARKNTSCSKRDGLYIWDYNRDPTKENLIQPDKKCWFIDNGPFECRAWKHEKSDIHTLRALEPDNACWTKLGDFSGLDVVKAFGVNNMGDL